MLGIQLNVVTASIANAAISPAQAQVQAQAAQTAEVSALSPAASEIPHGVLKNIESNATAPNASLSQVSQVSKATDVAANTQTTPTTEATVILQAVQTPAATAAGVAIAPAPEHSTPNYSAANQSAANRIENPVNTNHSALNQTAPNHPAALSDPIPDNTPNNTSNNAHNPNIGNNPNNAANQKPPIQDMGGTNPQVAASKKSDKAGNNKKGAQEDAAAGPIKLKPSDVYSAAYVFAYPLVLFDATKKLVTHSPEPNPSLMRAPINQFVHAKEIPAADLEIPDVTMDTLYSSAFIDLSKEPIIVSLPKSDRFYLMQMLDAWTEVFYSQGTRVNGNNPVNIALTGPNWRGTLPNGVQQVKAPGNFLWIIGRTEVNGAADYDKVHAQQDNYKLIPLSAWNKDYMPPKVLLTNPNEPILPIEQVDEMDDIYFFTKFLSLMALNPPHTDDTDIVSHLKTVGISPGQTIDPTKMDGGQISAISAGFRDAQQKLGAAIRKNREPKTGWDLAIKNVGRYGTDYVTRAVIAFNAIGANLPQDAVFTSTSTDSEGKTLQGSQDYIIHIKKEDLPPTSAFWSLTMYDNNNLLVQNDLLRYSLNSKSNLLYNPDGSLDIHLTYDSPQNDYERNWLPTPEGPFKLTLRIYSPGAALLDGSWTPPEIKKVAQAKSEN